MKRPLPCWAISNLVDRTTLTIFIIDFFFDISESASTVVPMARKTSGNSPSLHQESWSAPTRSVGNANTERSYASKSDKLHPPTFGDLFAARCGEQPFGNSLIGGWRKWMILELLLWLLRAFRKGAKGLH